MRRAIFLLFLFSSFYTSGQGTFGIRGGANYSYMRVVIDYSKFHVLDPNDPLIPPAEKVKGSVTPLLRSSFGLFLEQNFNNWIGLREELIYQRQGYKSVSFDGMSSSGKIRVDYAMIPVSFFWRVHPKLTLSSGNYIAVLVHTPGHFVDPKYYSDNLDFGFQSAVEYSILPKIGVGMSYYYGMANIGYGPTIERLRCGQLYLTYSFKAQRTAR